VRKLEHLLAIAARRGGVVLTSGATGSHHVLATAIHARRLGLDVEAVRFPQPETPHTAEMAAAATAAGVRFHDAGTSAAMPFVLARRWVQLVTGEQPATLVTPGGSTPVGVLGYVGAGIELAATSDLPEPDEIVVALGSGGSAVGLALGVALAGWRRTKVVAVRVADRIVTNRPVLAGIERGVRALLALGGAFPPRTHWTIDGGWFGAGYGHPLPAASAAARRARDLGIESEPTYTAKALAAAFARVDAGRRVLYVQTFAGVAGAAGAASSGVGAAY
jgi:1-aminocyclopropane-1-carboxylate deaminase/D-cysteine desulfhydrase-like pyridoxal-dependent ACC family enzyme